MIRKIIKFSSENSLVIIFITLFMSMYGIYCFTTLPVDAVPDTTNIQVQVITIAPGLVPEEVERQITLPMELLLNGIPGISQVRSTSRFALSHITVIFEEGTKILNARQLIAERMKFLERDIPNYYKLSMGPIVTGLGDIFHYAIIPKNKKLSELTMEEMMEIRTLQDWVVRPELLRIKGVAEVNTMGLYQRQFYIVPKLDKMHFYGITFQEIIDAIKTTNRNVGGSYIEKEDSQILIQGSGLLKNENDILNVPIKQAKNLGTILVADIAEVKLAKSLIVGSATFNGEKALIGSPLMLAGDNSRRVAVDVRNKIKEINQTKLKDHEIKILYDRSVLVNQTLKTVEHNLFLGCVLVILVLLLLIGDLRASIIASAMIPVSLLMTFIIMKHSGLSGNLMSLGALDFGIIIDGVVIIIDNCLRHLQERSSVKSRVLEQKEIKEIIVDATAEIMSASWLGRIIVVLVFVPLILLGGVEGKMFAPMAKTFIYGLISIFILSITTVPALASLFLKTPKSNQKPFLLRAVEKVYYPFVRFTLHRFTSFSLLSLFIFAISLFMFSRLGGEFIPRLDEGSAALRVIRKADIAPNYVIEEQKRLEKDLLSIPEVDTAFSRIGIAEIPDDPNGMNFSDLFVEFKPEKEWRHGMDRLKIKEEILKVLNKESRGAIFMMGQPIEMRTNELREGIRSDVSLKIFGEDLEQIVKVGTEIKMIVKDVQGGRDVELDVQGKNKLLKISSREDVKRTLAFSNEYLLVTVQSALGGVEIGKIYEGIRNFPLMLRVKEEERESMEKIKVLPIGNTKGLTLKLEEIANIELMNTFSIIARENSRRRVALLINIKDRDMESFVKEAAARVDKEVKLPPGIELQWGGNFKNLQNAKKRLSVILPITLFIIFMLIYYAFFNWILSLLIFICIPFAWVGGIWALKLSNLPFSISGGAGFIALSGIAVVNGMVLLAFLSSIRSRGISGDELIYQGVSLRLRPVLMTALTEIFGFLPMAVSTRLGSEVQKPLALVVIGGVITSTILTLILIPILYRKLENRIGKSEIIPTLA